MQLALGLSGWMELLVAIWLLVVEVLVLVGVEVVLR